MMKSLLAVAALALLVTPAAAQQYPTIVGEWYADEIGPQDCGTQFSTRIKAMSYAEETFICTFDDVRRDGWQVTWNGTCDDGSTRAKTRVVAVENSGQLSVSFNGDPGWSTLRRCDAKTSATPRPLPTPTASPPSVAPEVAAFCEDRWGTNYSMQVYCRDKEMAALRELRGGDAGIGYREIVDLALDHAIDAYRNGGMAALADYNSMCYSIVSDLPLHLACVATDYLGGLIADEGYFDARETSRRSILSARSVGLPDTKQYMAELMGIAGGRWSRDIN